MSVQGDRECSSERMTNLDTPSAKTLVAAEGKTGARALLGGTHGANCIKYKSAHKVLVAQNPSQKKKETTKEGSACGEARKTHQDGSC